MAGSNQDRQTVAMERLAASVERWVDSQLNPNAKKISQEHLDDWNLMTRADQAQYDHDPRNYSIEREAADKKAIEEKAKHLAADKEALAAAKAKHDKDAEELAAKEKAQAVSKK